MKLKDWANKQGISYLTAWRWFKASDPRLSKAYQSDSGTIIVPDESDFLEPVMPNTMQNDAMSLFLKKTVEFSKNNSSIEDFAAYVISNFSLKVNSAIENPKYSKHKPKSEEIQKHFKQFLPDEDKQEHLKAVKTLIKEQNLGKDFCADPNLEIVIPAVSTTVVSNTSGNIIDVNSADFSSLLSQAPSTSNIHVYGVGITTEGLVNRSVDLNTTPQQINHNGSTSQALSSSYFSTTSMINNNDILSYVGSTFQPTQKELQSVIKANQISESQELPRKRGRKPNKKASL